MTDSKGSGPSPEAISEWITTTWPETVVAEAMGATFFSLDPSHWPNFATVVTTDEHDVGAPSDLTARPSVFRLNIGVGRATFERLARDWGAGGIEPDPAQLDAIIPHPVYAKQRWIAILNPRSETFERVVKPLIAEAHDRLANGRKAAGSRQD